MTLGRPHNLPLPISGYPSLICTAAGLGDIQQLFVSTAELHGEASLLRTWHVFSAHRCAFLRDPPMSMTPQPHSSKTEGAQPSGHWQASVPSLYNYINYIYQIISIDMYTSVYVCELKLPWHSMH